MRPHWTNVASWAHNVVIGAHVSYEYACFEVMVADNHKATYNGGYVVDERYVRHGCGWGISVEGDSSSQFEDHGNGAGHGHKVIERMSTKEST